MEHAWAQGLTLRKLIILAWTCGASKHHKTTKFQELQYTIEIAILACQGQD